MRTLWILLLIGCGGEAMVADAGALDSGDPHVKPDGGISYVFTCKGTYSCDAGRFAFDICEPSDLPDLRAAGEAALADAGGATCAHSMACASVGDECG